MARPGCISKSSAPRHSGHSLDRNHTADSVLKNHIMKNFMPLAFVVTALFMIGCKKASAPNSLTDLGVVELSENTPKRLRLGDGKDCTLSATLLTSGNLQIVITTREKLAPSDTPAGFPVGMPVEETKTMTAPSGEVITAYIGQKLVRFTPQFKTL